jgi:type IV pilus assembly protein PilN
MIDINLLPHREARRVADLRESVAVLGLGLVLVAGGVYFANRSVGKEIAQATSTVRQLEADIERYKPEEAKVKNFRVQRDELEDKLAVIDSLDKARSGPVRMMEELARTTPERLWLKELNTNKGRITLRGESIDTGVVADFLRALNASKYFVNVDLDRTAGGSVVQGVRLVSFVITAGFALPSDEEEKQG